MSREDFVYLCMLFGAIPFGHIVKVSGSPTRKKLISLLAGIFVLGMTTGLRGVPHSFLAILGTYFIIRITGPRYGPWMAFIYIFSYLFFFRTCHWFGFAKPPPYSNAVQLLVTLRMCTIAFEGFEISSEDPQKVSKNKEPTKATLKVTLYDIFAYGYCYCGLLTGPYYRFKTYVDMLHQKSPDEIPTFMAAVTRLKYFPFYAAIYIPLNKNFPISHIVSPEFANHSWGLLYRMAYLVPTFFWFRWRFYIGWLLAESSCISMGLGAYPEECKCRPGQGPTVEVNNDDSKNKNVQKYDFETIRNINIYGIEFTPNMGFTMKNWNMTVQWWLYAFVYKKIPFKKFRLSIVLFVSAFWHGVKGGYYLCFMTVPFLVMAETRMEKLVQPSSSERLRKIYGWISWFLLYRLFEYLACSFMLLDLETVIRIWTKLYFNMHLVIIFFITLPTFFPTTTDVTFPKKEVEFPKRES